MQYSDLKLSDCERFPNGFAQQLLSAILERKEAIISRIIKCGLTDTETIQLRGQIAELSILEKAFETLHITPATK